MTKGPLIILSGPSGSGKSTVIDRVLADLSSASLRLHLAVSATTRAPRQGEVDGHDYYFWTSQRFHEEVHAGAFLEWAEVFGHSYGTLRSEVEPYRAQGTGVILEIDVQGAAQVRRLYSDSVSIFLRTSSLQAYEDRLRKRGADNEEVMRRRLAGAERELSHAAEYHYQVINDDLESAVAEVKAIVGRQFERGSKCSTS
jgi:guanylate kinase